MRQYQVIRINAKGTPLFAVFASGARSASYTRHAAQVVRDWLIERDNGYMSVATLRGGRYYPPDGLRQLGRTRPCTGPCCRKGPKRVRRDGY